MTARVVEPSLSMTLSGSHSGRLIEKGYALCPSCMTLSANLHSLKLTSRTVSENLIGAASYTLPLSDIGKKEALSTP
jgi:hypothetical protein